MNKIGIYKIENLINHKIYIGQSVNIERRWRDEKRCAFIKEDKSYNYPLSRAFRKYGINNFSFEIIEECSKEELNNKERFWINYYNSFFQGYNQTLGGDASNALPKENIIGIINDLKTTTDFHATIAEKWGVSTELVQGINTGRYWHLTNESYPLQKIDRSRKIWLCVNCGKEISKGSYKCKDCYNKENRVTDRPTREELKNLIRTLSFLEIGRKYKVSDNSIRKWCKAENLPYRKADIK